MCGIVGKVYRNADRHVNPELIERMKRSIMHRGPDGEATYTRGNVGLGYQRLAIIDLKTGGQPMFSEDGAVALVYNGEIYNFRELRTILEGLGHTFRTKSDTETVLHGYEQWGTEVVTHLRGMFAFAIWDGRQRRLFVARDRLGKKPLFYAHLKRGTPDESLVFGSELKALLADPDVAREVDLQALSHYLTYEYVPEPLSILKGVEKLNPAEWLTYRDGQVEKHCYWELRYDPKWDITEEHAIEETRARIEDAVRVRLVSDVPLGCFLSSGTDSSTVVAMTRRHITGPLKTFSAGVKSARHNEVPYCKQVAEHYGTDHHEFIIDDDPLPVLGLLAWHFDEPYGEMSAVPFYYLQKYTAEHVKVIMTGDGGDESFGGYERYKRFHAFDRTRRLPRALRALADAPLGALASALPNHTRLERLSYINRHSLLDDARLFVHNTVIFHHAQKRKLLATNHRALLEGPDGNSENLMYDVMTAMHPEALLDRMMRSDVVMNNPGVSFPKLDRLTMAHSTEARSPFFDHLLMEWVARMPIDIKFAGGNLKALLKKVRKGVVPAESGNRPKVGFGAPHNDWFNGVLKPVAAELLGETSVRERGLFDPKYVQLLLDDHTSRRQNNRHRLWTLLMFEAWCQTFLDRPEPLAGPVSFG
jgi:asparagine synthase (glutamine-hydrolysing)